jgi:hypothetical protein
MIIFPANKKIFRSIFVSFLIMVFFISGFPSDLILKNIIKAISDRNVVDNLYLASKDANVIDKGMLNLFKSQVKTAEAATYKIQTGYYIGDGGTKSITGLGFKPDMVMLKSDTAAIPPLLKTTAMPVLNATYLGNALADVTTGSVILNDDGFTVSGGISNVVNVRYTWVAFTGSDCSATGTFCVGSYTGTGANLSVNTGFQPDLVMVKQSTAVAANWRSSSMPVNYGQYFTNTNQNTNGALFTTLSATGFTVGNTNSASAGIFYYVAFKSAAGSIKVGSYTGTSVDNTNITGVGFVPDFVFLKNVTAVSAVYNIDESYGDNTSYFAGSPNLTDSIQALQTDGFQIGTNSTANGSGNIIYYAAFAGASNIRNTSGTYQMAEGTYTGTGQYLNVTGLSFKPDLVIVKASTAVVGVFKTSLMGGDSTAYLDSATANIIGAITSINSDGFTVYNHVTTNTVGTVYHWQAFGNAWNPETNSGASDFYIGSYYGNGIDNRNITRLPFQVDMVAIKITTAAAVGLFRTSSHVGDLCSNYSATADAANGIQVINTDGFQIGTATNVNSAANSFFYFGFKNGTGFKVGTYTGTGVDGLTINNLGFDPDLVWIKRNTAVAAVTRPRTLVGDLTQYFTALIQTSGKIKALVTGGFQLGTGTETNAASGAYIYVAWQINTTQNTTAPTYKIQTGYYIGNGGAKSISGLGFKPEMIILKSNTAQATALIKTVSMPVLNTAYLGSATGDANTGIVILGADGFTVSGTISNAANIRYTWIAFTGSDCSATGTFCVGTYTGTGANLSVNTGFQPDLVIAKQTTAAAANWRSSAMPANYGQYFMATAQNTNGSLFTTLNTNGFTAGTTNSASAALYYFVAFRSVAGSIKVGTYNGTAVDNTNITGVGFVPDFLFLKNGPTAVSAVYNTDESYGDSSSYFSATLNLADSIQMLQTDGFQVGTNSTANGSGNAIYYAAFGGVGNSRNTSGVYQMTEGIYTGTGQYLNITGLGFKPDLVIVKTTGAVSGVFRTSLMGGDSTAYLDSATANIAGAITSLDSDGFTVYNHATTNTSGIVYHWQAFGNAWNPETNSGASDFYIGTYFGNGIDNRNVTRLPFQADMVSIKPNTTAMSGIFRTSSHVGDSSSYYVATANTTNNIQSLSVDGFQIGTGSSVNAASVSFFYFGFKNSANFKVGSYTGTGVTGFNVTSPGFDPDLVWIKGATAVAGVMRPRTLTGDLTQYFIATAQAAGKIVAFVANGFQLGTGAETNTAATSYFYVAWKTPSALAYPPYGELTSAVFDTTGSADGPSYNSIMWRGLLGGPAFNQGQVLFQLAASDSSSGPWNYVGGSCTSADWFSYDSDLPVQIGCYSLLNNKRYFRYKIRICANDCISGGMYTPTVNDINVNWSP